MCLPPVAMRGVEELHEADVLWPLDRATTKRPQQQQAAGAGDPEDGGSGVRRRRAGGSTSTTTAPVPIPAARSAPSRPSPWDDRMSYDGSDDDEAATEAGFVPPHVLAATRRWCPEGRAASSVCVGRGRTLKGRDLQCVRDAVLRMTGFLET